MGGSMGFTKMEGTTVNVKDKIAYSPCGTAESMVHDGNGLERPASGIALDKALNAGAVMAHNLKGWQKDSDGSAINSEWVPVDIDGACQLGEDIAADALGNTANPDKIANPDNLKFSEKMRTLFIGEDSSTHVNNFLWAYNVDTKRSRACCRARRAPNPPACTRSTSSTAGPTSSATSSTQATGAACSHVKATLDPLINANYKNKFGAAVGYLTGEVSQAKLSK